MITGCYLPTWCQLDLDDGRTVNAIVFIMDPRHPEYESDTRAQVIAPLIAAASGPLGTNAQYLFSLEQELIKLGMQDDGLNDLLVSVKTAGGELSGWCVAAGIRLSKLPHRGASDALKH